MCAEAGKHSLVAGFQGKEIRAMLRQQLREFPFFDDPEPDFRDKDKDRPARRVDKVARDKDGGKAKEKPDDKTKQDEDDFDMPAMLFVLLPFKPLVMLKTGLVTVDLDREYTVSATASFANKERADDGDIALKSLLYVFREFVVSAPRTSRELRPLAPLSESARKAIKATRVERKGNTLSTSVSLSVAQATAKKIGEEFAAAKARREDRWRDKDRKKDGFRKVDGFPKDADKDKAKFIPKDDKGKD
jgi:hypothetical protein